MHRLRCFGARRAKLCLFNVTPTSSTLTRNLVTLSTSVISRSVSIKHRDNEHKYQERRYTSTALPFNYSRLYAVLIGMATSMGLLSQSLVVSNDASFSSSSSDESDVSPVSIRELHPDAYQELKTLLGDRFSIEIDDRWQHGKSIHSYHAGHLPWGVAFVLSTSEVSSVLKICSAYKIPVIPVGSATSLEGQAQPINGGISVDLSGMRNVVSFREADQDVTVEAGLSWNELNEFLSPYKLFFPVDPGPGASIGGMCGTCCSGTNAYRYGTMRHNVLSLTVVLMDGRVLVTGRRARKSSAGYALTQLFIGSEGTLGIVTEVTVRVQHVPEKTKVAVVQFDSLHSACRCVEEIVRGGIQMGAIELLDSMSIKAINLGGGFSFLETPTLFLKFTGSQSSVDNQVSSVLSIAESNNAKLIKWAVDDDESHKIWDARKSLLWSTLALKPSNYQAMTTDVCVPVSRLPEAVEAAAADVVESGLVGPIVGHVGDGNFHVCILVDPSSDSEMKAAKNINERMVLRALAVDGTCTGEHGIGVGKREFLLKELGQDAIDVMWSLKSSVDPNNLLNPGKIFLPRKDQTKAEIGEYTTVKS